MSETQRASVSTPRTQSRPYPEAALPRVSEPGHTWAGPAFFAILGGMILFVTLKRRRARGERRELSTAERSRAEGLIDEGT